MSRRATIVNDIAESLLVLGLSEVHGIMTGTNHGYHYADFGTAHTLDGQVRYYDDKFVCVQWKTAYRAMPQYGNRVFNSVEDTLKFIELAFVKHEYEAAFEVPIKP